MSIPMTMAGEIDECVLISFGAPVERVAPLLPAGLEPVTRAGLAFWNVVACHIRSMRPAGLPEWMGASYHHVAYRILCSARLAGGRELQGLYFVRSDADHELLAATGNAMTDFRFNFARIERASSHDGCSFRVRTGDGAGDAEIEVERAEGDPLPEDAPFDSVEEARAFLKYRPLGLSMAPGGGRVRVAEVERDESKWDERRVRVVRAEFEFFRSMKGGPPRLILATRVAPIAYRWRLGRVEPPTP